MYTSANLRSRGTSGSSSARGTRISLSTIVSSLSLSTRLSISTLWWNGERDTLFFYKFFGEKIADIQEEVTYRRSSESSWSRWSSLSTLTLRKRRGKMIQSRI